MVADGDLPKEVLSVQRYESGPPGGMAMATTSPDGLQVSSDGDTLATSKQEEWVTKRKTELVTTKQIETRVKRQVVLEDGKVVEDSGPLVTTTTTEDTDKNESEHTEHKQHGEDQDVGEGWVPVDTTVPDDAIVKETNERKVTTHDEVEDILETEEVQHYGDMTNQNLVRAIREGGDTRRALLTKDRRDLNVLSSQEKDSAQKRILQQSKRHDRTTDIEDTKEVSKVNDIGNLVTEITKRREHEEFHNEDIPSSDSDEFEHIENRDGSHDYSHAKSQNYIDYLAVPKGGGRGVKVGEGPRIVSENISSQRLGDEDLWDSVSERIRKHPPKGAITTRPIDFNQEERTRKKETNRWLNSHFGSSSSSLSSEASPRTPPNTTPDGIHVTMTSTCSPPPPPPMPGSNAARHFPAGKRISFGDTPSPRPSPVQKDVHFDLRNSHEDVTRSLNSKYGQQQRSSTVTKSGGLWDEEPTPTPPPRSRRSRHSPDARYSRSRSPDHIEIIHRGGNNINNMNQYSRKFTSSPQDGLTSSYQLQKSNDIGERKGYERREHSFGYSGPTSQSDQYGHSDYVTKHSNYYKTDETNNPAQNSLYENGKADVTERKSVERREKVFSYDGPSQKQFHPKYILGTPASTMGRLKGIEGTGAIIEEDAGSSILSPSSTMPRKRFYFGDEDGGLNRSSQQRITSGRSATIDSRERHYGTDDINVSILNKYNNDTRRTGSVGNSLNRSMSFTPKTLTPLERSYNTLQQNSNTLLTQTQKHHQAYKSNPHLVDSPDLLSPRLISSMSRSVRDVNRNDQVNGTTYSNKQESAARSRQSFLENIKRTSADLFDRTGTSSPVRTITPTKSLRSANSPRPFGTNSPISDDFQETHRMTSNTPDHERGKPKISTDTTSKFSKKILRGLDGQPAGKVESSETTTRTKSRFKESEIMYPNGQRVASPSSNLRTDYGQRTNQGTVIIPVRDTNTGRSRYAS